MSDYYYYGLAAMLYLATCWAFAAVRWWLTCREPKSRHDYIWPDRKLMVVAYLCAMVTLPYTINPTDESAWILTKSYFPATYCFYFGMLLLCFFGSVKQWERWKLGAMKMMNLARISHILRPYRTTFAKKVVPLSPIKANRICVHTKT